MANNPFPGTAGIKLVASSPSAKKKRKPKAPTTPTKSGQFIVGLGEGPYANTGFVASVPYTHGLHDLPLTGTTAPRKKGRPRKPPRPVNPLSTPTYEKPPKPVAATPAAPPPLVRQAPVVRNPAPVSVSPIVAGKPAAARGGGSGPSIAKQVQTIVDAIIAPQLASLTADETQRRNAYATISRELLNAAKNAPGAIESVYNDAIAQQEALGQAGAQALTNANPNADVQALLAAANAPQAQRDQVASNLNNVFAGGGAVLNETQGVMPASSLVSNKAAQLAFANTLPTVAAQTGSQNLGALSAAFAKARADVLAQRPKLALDAQAQIEDQRAKAEYNKQLDLYRRAQFGETVRQHDVQNRQAQQRLDIATEQALSNLYGTDSKGNLTLAGRKAATAELKARKKAAGMTPGQYASLTAKAQKMADALYYGVPPVTRKDGTVVKPGRPALSYQQALKRLQTTFKGLKLADAQGVLDTYYKPGEDGRPYLSYQVRMALIQAGADAKLVDRAAQNPYIAERLLKEYGVGS